MIRRPTGPGRLNATEPKFCQIKGRNEGGGCFRSTPMADHPGCCLDFAFGTAGDIRKNLKSRQLRRPYLREKTPLA